MSVLKAIVTDVQGKVTRNGKVLRRRQRLHERMSVEERTLILGDGATVSLVRSDDKAFIIRNVSRWTFPGTTGDSVLPPGTYHRIDISIGGDQIPVETLSQIPQLADRFTELQGLLSQHQQNNDLVGEALVRVQIAEVASRLNLEEFAAENRTRAEEIADIVRGRLGP